jgi:hypothetical protein
MCTETNVSPSKNIIHDLTNRNKSLDYGERAMEHSVNLQKVPLRAVETVAQVGGELSTWDTERCWEC